MSTTVASENFAFLEAMVKSGRSDSIAQAVDLAIERLRLFENRIRLDRATSAYFEGLGPEAQLEEEQIASLLNSAARGVDVDVEP